MKFPIRAAIIIGIVAVLFTIAGVRWLRAELIVVRLYTVTPGPVAETVANTRAGTIKACQRAKLAPNAGGQVTVLNVTEGSRVERGDVLMELWHADLDAQLAMQETEAAAAHDQARETCLRSEVARRDAKRLRDLKQKDFVSEERLDQAQTQADAADAACDAARGGAKASTVRLDVTREAIARTVLVAPFAGIVAEVNAELGEFITPSPTGIQTLPAVDLIDDGCLFVSAPIDEVDAPQIEVGMPVRITLNAFKDREFSGTVCRIAPYVLELEKQARTVEVEADFVTGDAIPRLLIGYSADIEVIVDRRDQVLRVPSEALMDGHRLYVVGEDERLEERGIESGLSNWEFTEVISGLQAGARVVLTPGKEGVAAGVAVREASES